MTDDAYERAKTALEVLGNGPANEAGPEGVREGFHYAVLAYTDFADMLVPTVVVWNYEREPGDDYTTDFFRDKEESLEHRERAVDYHQEVTA